MFDDQHNIMLTLDRGCIQGASNNRHDIAKNQNELGRKTAKNENKTHSENSAYIYYGLCARDE